MAENPLAIRAPENVKALFNELAEAGNFENKGEFLNRLLVQYQLETAKQEVSLLKPAIEIAEMLTWRLLEALNGTAAAILTKDEKQRQEVEDAKAVLQERIAELEQTCAEDEGRIQALTGKVETSEISITEAQDKIKRLDSALSDKDALLKEYSDKIDTQTKLDNLLSILIDQQGKSTKPASSRGKATDKDGNNS